MKVTYTRTGGFAPMPVSCTLDTTTMPEDEARELERLVSAGGIMHATSKRVPAARDVRYHTVQISTDKQPDKEVEWDDISIPAEARPLLQFLQSRAKPMLDD